MHRPDAQLRRARARVLGDGEQGVDRQHRLAGAEREALRDRARGAQPGERAGAAAEGDRVEVGERDARRRRAARGWPAAASPTRARRRRRRARRHARRSCRATAHPLGRSVESDQRRHRDARDIASPCGPMQTSLAAASAADHAPAACDHRRHAIALRRHRRPARPRLPRAALALVRRAARRARAAGRARGAVVDDGRRDRDARPAARRRRRARARRRAARRDGRVWCRRSARARPRLAWQADRAGQPGVAHEAGHHLRGARPARPGLHLVARRSGCEGTVADGVLDGNLVIKGHGDPQARARARCGCCCAACSRLGVREIRGDIVLDRSAFDAGRGNPADFDGEPLRPYNAGADALLLNYQVGGAAPSRPTRRAASHGQRRAAAGRRRDRRARCRSSAGACERLARRAEGRLRRSGAPPLRRQLPGGLRREGLAGRLCRPRRATTRARSPASGPRWAARLARQVRDGRAPAADAELRAALAAAGRGDPRHQQVQQQRDGAAALPDARRCSSAARHARGGARGAAPVAGRAHRRAGEGAGDRQRLGAVARRRASARALLGAAAAGGLGRRR